MKAPAQQPKGFWITVILVSFSLGQIYLNDSTLHPFLSEMKTTTVVEYDDIASSVNRSAENSNATTRAADDKNATSQHIELPPVPVQVVRSADGNNATPTIPSVGSVGLQQSEGNNATTARVQLPVHQEVPPQTKQEPHRFHDTSVIITSNLIPTHPDIAMINDTIHSLYQYIEGFSLDTPVYISVDKPKRYKQPTDQIRLEQYIVNVSAASFLPLTNVTVVPMDVHRHLAGSINHTLYNFVDTPFVYILQHDLPFCRHIDQHKILDAMKEHPDILYNVRFRLINGRNTIPNKCLHYTDNNGKNYSKSDFTSTKNGLDFYYTKHWSDNNHLTRTDYYKKLLTMMGFLGRAMEEKMMNVNFSGGDDYQCAKWGQQILGEHKDGLTHICHLDGRKSRTYNGRGK